MAEKPLFLSAVPAISIIAAAALLAPVRLLAERPRVSPAFGFGGLAAPGRWNPLRVSCGGELEGGLIELERRAEDGAILSVETFPYAAGRTVECPVFLDDGLDALELRLKAGGELLSEEGVPLRARTFPGHIVLASGLSPVVQAALGRLLLPREPVQVVSVKTDELPVEGLDYDGVSALVLRDPGRSLSPARVEAMLGWLGGGGSLALIGEASLADSLASAFLDPSRAMESLPFVTPSRGKAPSLAVATLGAGRIAMVSGDPGSLPPGDAEAFWSAALGLRPFERSERLAPGLVMPPPRYLTVQVASAEAKDSRALAFYLPFAALIVLMASRKPGRSRLVALASAAALAAALVAAPLLDRAGRREARASARVLVLPGGTGLLEGFALRSPFYPQGEPLGPLLSRRPVAVGAEEGGSGVLDGRSPAAWSHGSGRPVAALRETGPDSLVLMACVAAGGQAGKDFPALIYALRDAEAEGSLPRLPRDAKAAYVEPGGLAWRLWDGRASTWDRVAEAPAWLGLDESWVSGLCASFPRRGFVVGLSPASPLGFTVMGDRVGDLVWASPSRPAGEF